MAVREAFHIATTGRPGPGARRRPEGRAAEPRWTGTGRPTTRSSNLPGYKPTTKGHPRMIKEAAELILASRAPGDLRRRRHPQGPRRRGAARAGRADRHPRRHHADGPRRVPRRPPAVPRHAGHARQLHRGHGDAEGRPADRARRPLRRPGHRQGRRRSRPTPRSSTSTSTRPSWARCAGPTCRSSATAGSSSRSSIKAIRDLLDGGTAQADIGAWKSRISGWQRAVPADLRAERAGRGAEAAVLPRAAARQRARRHASSCRGVGQHQMWTQPVLEVQRTRTRGSTPAASARWASRCRPRSAPRSAGPTAWCGRSTATAASR